MKLTQRIGRAFAVTSATRNGVCIAAGLALTLGGMGACNDTSILDVTDPDILNISDYNTPAGADPLRFGVIGQFTTAFDGGTDAFTTAVGNMTDEMLASDTFDDRRLINARKSLEVNSVFGSLYRNLQRARTSATAAILILNTTQPTPTYNRGELYMTRGYVEMFLGEGWCSGVPFSSEDGVTQTFGEPLTTDQIFTAAAASFDSAIALADTNSRIKYGAQIGKGRALLNLGRFNEAAAAVAGVPQSFVLYDYHSPNSSGNGIWSAIDNGATRYMLTSSEGINGLPFLANHDDPRVDWSPSNRTAFNSLFVNIPTENKFTRYGNGIVSTGVEAKLIGLEARLQGGTQTDFDAVYSGLNDLRASGPPVVPLMTSGAPTTLSATVDLLYRERAYWMWLTGHRLGDLRRLVRIYNRDAETVFPTGPLTLPLIGTYGTSTNITIPFDERNNPNFHGCLPGA